MIIHLPIATAKASPLSGTLKRSQTEGTHDSPFARLDLRKLYRNILGPWLAQQLPAAAQGFHNKGD